jgi:hypothetical protein
MIHRTFPVSHFVPPSVWIKNRTATLALAFFSKIRGRFSGRTAHYGQKLQTPARLESLPNSPDVVLKHP